MIKIKIELSNFTSYNFLFNAIYKSQATTTKNSREY